MTNNEKLGLVIFIMGIVFYAAYDMSVAGEFFCAALSMAGVALFFGSGKTTK